jgi:hypothetical protein
MKRTIDTELSSFRMKREGQFLANWSTLATKCGPATAQPIYQYTCDIVTGPSLDEQGFIIDNLAVHQYFVDTYGKAPLPAVSCERMAAHAVKSIKAACKKIGLPLHSVAVAVSGMSGAWLTAEWHQ